MSRILFIGNIQHGLPPTGGGAQAKNQIFLDYLQQKFGNVTFYDTWKKSRMISLLVICLKIIIARKKIIILSLSFNGVYLLSKILTRLKIQRNIYYWVVGGGISVKKHDISAHYLSYFKYIIVQGNYIKAEFENLRLNNVKVVHNFKRIEYYPTDNKKENNILRFVFLSRIIKDKGIELIIEAVRQLGVKRFEVDLYGSLSPEYSHTFFENLDLSNIRYKGFLNLQKKENYDILASYDVMIFPTWFQGEGFPGILIDAFIAGLPVIASSFRVNPEIIIDGKNGVLIPTQNIEELKEAMLGFITGKYDLSMMKHEARRSASKFDVYNVLNDYLLTELGIK